MYIFDIDMSEIRDMIEDNRFDDFIVQLLQTYESWGPLPGILLPFLEAFLSFLPLFVFVVTNAAAYGLFKGFLLSWIGASAGAMCVFLLVRKLGEIRLFKWIKRNKQVIKITSWLEKHGFGPLFFLMAFPFSPSAIVNFVAALSQIKFQQFALAVILGKAIMIFSVSFVGDSIASFAQNPLKTILVGIGIVLFWLFGKYMERRLQKRARLSENVQDE
ncbi:TVP38/TMEM64 family protein [Radiobacillus sp. PE A8.2]|uniref:TVP38/TMEM64 family protein n=1 Tax=Radiobacillus sp. PE A8.2 TaxID=3380349 RepID=UPI00388DA63D